MGVFGEIEVEKKRFLTVFAIFYPFFHKNDEKCAFLRLQNRYILQLRAYLIDFLLDGWAGAFKK